MAGTLVASALVCLVFSPAQAASPPPDAAQGSALEQATGLDLSCMGGPRATGRCRDAQALSRLAWECHRRTSIPARLVPTATPLVAERLFETPLMIWQDQAGVAPPTEAETQALGTWLLAGGMLLVDPADPAGSAGREAFLRDAEASVAAATGFAQPEPIDANHVLFRSFYLLTPGAPHLPSPPKARGLRIGRRLAVVFADEPWLSAIAVDDRGAPLHKDAAPDAHRESRLRMAINWLMYSLCLDYKDDQVHLPYLLMRRGH